ncbi:unnamed protein product [Ixodes hexagonus]
MTPRRPDVLNMISNNVMSFVKKMVKSGSDEDGIRLGSKFRATVAAAGLSPRASRADLGHLTPEERSILARVWQKEDEFEKMTLVKKAQTPPPTLQQSVVPIPTLAAPQPIPQPPPKPCRICRKGIQAGEPCHTCDDCKQLVCDDCASYSRDPHHAVWRCSCCRRRQSHDRLGPPPGAGMHRVPSVRRMVRRLAVHFSSSNCTSILGSTTFILTFTIHLATAPQAERIVQDTGSGGCTPNPGPRGSFMLSEPLKEALRLEMQMQVDGSCLAPPSARTIVKRGSYAGQTEWQRNGLRASSPERRHSYQKTERASSESSLEEEYLPRAGRLRRRSRVQRHKSSAAADVRTYALHFRSRILAHAWCLLISCRQPRSFTNGKLMYSETPKTTITSWPLLASELAATVTPTPSQEEDSEGNEWRSNTSSSSALDSLETDLRSSRRLDVLQRYSSESSDVSDLSRGAPESSPDERRSIPSVTVDAIGGGGVCGGGGGALFEELRRCSTGSALPRMPIPENQLCLFPGAPHGSGSTHSLDLPREEQGKPERRASAPEGDNIKIVIDDVDSQGPAPTPLRKRLLLQRDPSDTGARTRGFGMRVMGGKKAPDGHLYAAVAWVLAGSSADLAGLQQGDVILEWNGTSLVDRSYEEVCAVLDKSGNTVEIHIETGRKMSSRELRASTGNIPARKCSTGSVGGDGSSTRRKLPKTPDEICHTAHVQGMLGVRIWYDGADLEVTVLGARGLPPRRSYVKLRLHDPCTGIRGVAMKTPISEPVANPEWNKTFVFPAQETLEGLYLDLSVWDHRPVGSNAFLGEVQQLHLDTDKACLLPPPPPSSLSRSNTTCSITGGMLVFFPSTDDVTLRVPYGRRGSYSLPLCEEETAQYLPFPIDDKDLVKSSSMDSMLLHPDDAWQGNPVERKSSAPTVYAISPGRNKQLLAQDSLPELYSSSPTQGPERAKSASFKMRRNVNMQDAAAALDERRSLPRRKLSRTVSLKSDDHAAVVNPRGDGADSSSGSERCSVDTGPGQKNSRRDLARLGELKLGFIMTKGQLEVEVVSARGLPLGATGTPPDTYVKTYLKEGERQMQKRKTRVVRHSCEPQYRQTLKYTAADVLGRSLLVTVWERAKGFEHNQPLGAALVQLDRLELSHLTLAWYALQTPAGPAATSGPRGDMEDDADEDDSP